MSGAEALVDNLHEAAAACLRAAEPAAKVALSRATSEKFRNGALTWDREVSTAVDIASPGRPARPQLVAPRQLPQRGLGTPDGRAAFVHAIAHIEFNAIDLAWDAIYRFRGLPAEFYADWVSVADDESRHFALLQTRLEELGHAYGDFDAHNGLWEMAERTAHSCLARMALVPRVLEARGLDVTPAMITKLRALGDTKTVDILEVILREEVAHVAAGSRWFAWCCERDSRDPDEAFESLLREFAGPALRAPFNLPARRAAGFTDRELMRLQQLAQAGA
jgi:uncharacterized ferritin-like protein (DUF455 family)